MTLERFLSEWHSPSPSMMVYTSGSTGEPRLLSVEKKRMEASARMTCSFLGLSSGDTTLLCMPLEYIAGKMVVVRALTCGLRLIKVKPSGHPLKNLTESPAFAAMVPMQVFNSLQSDDERRILKGIRQLIIGGGSVDESLIAELRDFPNAVWSTYGMTETLSHIALRRINGSEASTWYTPLPNVSVSTDEDGCLVINAPDLNPLELHTHDLAEMNSDGRRFRIIGRSDNIIDTGGIKVQAEEVESVLRGYINEPFIITKQKNEKFGEVVVLLTSSSNIRHIKDVCERVLSKYWQPKEYVFTPRLPVTATGKPARAEAMKIVEKEHSTRNI